MAHNYHDCYSFLINAKQLDLGQHIPPLCSSIHCQQTAWVSVKDSQILIDEIMNMVIIITSSGCAQHTHGENILLVLLSILLVAQQSAVVVAVLDCLFLWVAF
jgi:hypothetical protein